jgi:hypothetical protein
VDIDGTAGLSSTGVARTGGSRISHCSDCSLRGISVGGRSRR